MRWTVIFSGGKNQFIGDKKPYSAKDLAAFGAAGMGDGQR
jgi:hypothetical protein